MFGAHVIDKKFGPPKSTELSLGKSNFESYKCCKELGAAELSDLFCYCHIGGAFLSGALFLFQIKIKIKIHCTIFLGPNLLVYGVNRVWKPLCMYRNCKLEHDSAKLIKSNYHLTNYLEESLTRLVLNLFFNDYKFKIFKTIQDLHYS